MFNKGAGRSQKLDQSEIKYVNLELSDRDREPLAEWVKASKAEIWSMAESMANAEYQFSLKWDDKFSCFLVNVTCMDKNSPNFGGVMPSRSDALEEAFIIAIYKHYVVCKEQWPIGEGRARWG